MKKQKKLASKRIIKKVTSILDQIIEDNMSSLVQEDYHVRPGYGYDKFYLNWVDGSYDMSLQGLIHYILYEKGIYEKILNKKQYASLLIVINDFPESIYSPDEDYAVEDLLCKIYYQSIVHVREKLLAIGCDVKEAFSEYGEYTE